MSAQVTPEVAKSDAIVEKSETDCCVVGGGPAGAMLALLLARRGVRVTLLEMHKDFDREFRGDTVHPSTLEILDQLGLLGNGVLSLVDCARSSGASTSFGTPKSTAQPCRLRTARSRPSISAA